MQINWYLKGNAETEGPFSEPEIRARLLAGAYSPGAEVKQGESTWRSADEVKQLFVRVYQEGWYVKSRDKTVGPFITQKILDLHQAGKLPKKAMVRQGASTVWTPVAEMIESLRQKQSLIAQLSEAIITPTKAKDATEEDDDPEVIEELDANKIAELEIVTRRPIGQATPASKTLEIRGGASNIVTVKPISSIPVVPVSPTPIQLPTPAYSPQLIRSSDSSRRSADVEVIKAAIPVAEVVFPATTSMIDPFRNIVVPQSAPAITAVPSYSQPIASNYLQVPSHRSSDSQLPLSAKTTWMLFKCLMGLAIIPRVLQTLLVLLTAFTGNGLPSFIALSIWSMEINACAAISTVIGIWLIVIAFKESVEQGLLCLFLPFYSLYFIFSRWERCWVVMLLSTGATLWALAIVVSPFVGVLIMMLALK